MATAVPTVASVASASPNLVTGKTTILSVLGADDGGEAALTYTWATTGAPPAAVTFSANGTNSAKSSTATFTKAGTYSLQCTIKDVGNLTVTSTVAVSVNQTATSVAVTPASASVVITKIQQFSAVVKDQFGAELAAQPTITWSPASVASGTLGSTGLFTANTSEGGPYTLTATGAGKFGTATVKVINAAPTVATAAAASPNPTTGTTVLSVLGADDGGEAALTYTWATVGTPPASVTFSANSTNAAKSSTATLTNAGIYMLQCTIKDAGNLTVTSTVAVTMLEPLFQEARANANPVIVTGTTTSLFVTGANVADPAVTYTWKTVGFVPGPVSLSVNGNNAAKQTVATFTKPGKYIFCVNGSTLPQWNTNGREYVVVNVQQKVSSLALSPASAVVAVGGAQTFTPIFSDQFAGVMSDVKNTSALQWRTTGGAINVGGVFTSRYAGGPFLVTCSNGTQVGNASITVREINRITQVWLERIIDSVDEPSTRDPLLENWHRDAVIMFRLHVRNPAFLGWADSTAKVPILDAPNTLLELSGTAKGLIPGQGGFIGIDYYAFEYEYKANGSSVISTPLGTRFFKYKDPGNDLYTKDIYVRALRGDDTGINGVEGSETITMSLKLFPPSGPDRICIVPEGKPSSVTSTIVETKKGYRNSPPTITAPASANTNPVIPSDLNLGYYPLSGPMTMSTTLSVAATDNLGDAPLTYAWETVGSPPAAVLFSGVNGTAAQKSTVATFSRAGIYTFKATVTDGEGADSTSQVVVNVKHAPTPMLKVIPEIITVVAGQQQQFTAIPVDQFGDPIDDWLDADGNVTGWKPTGWVVNDGGNITSTGLFTAGSTVGGPFSVIAYGGRYANANLYAPATTPSVTANWSTSGKATVSIAKAPVVNLAIISPLEGAVITTVPFLAEVSVTGDNVLDEVRLDGSLLQIFPSTPYSGALMISPPDGLHTILAEAETIFGTRVTTTRTVTVAARPLEVTILSPPDNKVFNQPMVFITVRRPTLTTSITIQGLSALVSDYEAYAWVRLNSGSNTITTRGTDGTRTGQDTAVVVFTPPPGYNPNGDSDGDGVINSIDLFPNDPNESGDRDSDGVGNNQDTQPDNPNASSTLIITNPPRSQTYRSSYNGK